MTRGATAKKKRAQQPTKPRAAAKVKATPARKPRVTQMKLTLAVEFFNSDGKVREMRNFDVLQCEADFGRTLESVATEAVQQIMTGAVEPPGR